MSITKRDFLKNLQKNKYLQLLPLFKEEKTQKFITLALTLFTLSFFGIFAIGPTFSTISKLNKELEDNRFIEEQLKQKINNLSILQEKYAALQNDLPEIFSAVPKNPDVPIFAGQIQTVAKNSNIKILGLQVYEVEAVSQSKNNKKYTSFNYNISAEGNYSNISQFISSLIRMKRITTVDTITVTNTSKNLSEDKLRLTIKGSSYFKK